MEQLNDIFLIAQLLNRDNLPIIEPGIGRARHILRSFIAKTKKGGKHPRRHFIIRHLSQLCKHIQRYDRENFRNEKPAVSCNAL